MARPIQTNYTRVINIIGNNYTQLSIDTEDDCQSANWRYCSHQNYILKIKVPKYHRNKYTGTDQTLAIQ